MMNDKDILEKLKAARELVQNGWTTKYFALDSEGKNVLPRDATAVKFCAFGAICNVTSSARDNKNFTESYYVTNALVTCLPAAPEGFEDWNVNGFNKNNDTTDEGVFEHWNLSRFNDHPDTTHEDVVALFDRKIKQLKLKTLVESD